MNDMCTYRKRVFLVSGIIFLIILISKLFVYSSKSWMFSEWYTNILFFASIGAVISGMVYVLLAKLGKLFYRREIIYFVAFLICEVASRGFKWFCIVHMGNRYYDPAYGLLYGLIAALTCVVTLLLAERDGYYPESEERNQTKKCEIDESRISYSLLNGKLDNRAINFRFEREFYANRNVAVLSNKAIAGKCGFNAIEKYGIISPDEKFYYISYDNILFGYFLTEENENSSIVNIKEISFPMEVFGRVVLQHFFEDKKGAKFRIVVENIYKDVIFSVIENVASKYLVLTENDKPEVEFTADLLRV